jgi:2-deoxy-D-gluconate 3-dehydrogenase
MAKRFVEDHAFSNDIVGRTPLRRWGVPEDFKGITAFLASSASDFITGARIMVDGGISNM